MKRSRFLALLISIVLLLSACGTDPVTLQDQMAISEDGIVSARILSQLKNENAIVVFRGASAGLTYEWTVFGSDIDQPKDVNLHVDLQPQPNYLQITFGQAEPFGFPLLLSVRLNEVWQTDSANAWVGDQLVSSVSLTGTNSTIVNLPVNEFLGVVRILPDGVQNVPEQSTDSQVSRQDETYLSAPGNTDTQLHSNQPLPSASSTEATSEQTPIPQDNYLSTEQKGNESVYSSTPSTPGSSATGSTPNQSDSYLSGSTTGSEPVYSTTTGGGGGGKDRYQTDPIPAGKPKPAEPQDQQVNTKKSYTCTFSIECSTILNNLSQLDSAKLGLVPSNGVILPKQTVTFYEGESVFDVLQRICREKSIHMESSWTPIYNSAYIEGIHNLYEFDCGDLSGWMYRVNGWYPNYGCSRYQLKQGDVVEWRYTCDLGKDIGGGNGW